MLLDTENTPLPSRSLLSPRWMGPFNVLARTAAPHTYRLDVTVTWRACAEFSVERLRPYLRSPDHLGGTGAPPPRWSAPTRMTGQRRRTMLGKTVGPGKLRT